MDNAAPHLYSECANRGICDRSTGACKCFSGYTGQACERKSCANDCSGHGMCRMVQDLPSYDPSTSLEWDEKALSSCVCDGGYFGADCSLRRCPFGDDPVTVCDQTLRTEQVQRVTVSVNLDFGNNVAASGVSDIGVVRNAELALSYMTPGGSNFTTRRVENAWGSSTNAFHDASEMTALGDGVIDANLETAIESLPNFAVRDVTVTKNSGTAAAAADITNSWDVTFHHEQDGQNSYGPQSLLHCHQPNACPGAGCQPKFTQLYAAASYENDGAAGAHTAVTTANWRAALASGAQRVRFHADSVLHCPTGQACTNAVGTVGMFEAAIQVIVVGHATDASKVFVQTFGSTAGESNKVTAATILSGGLATGLDTTALTGFSYAGELTSGNAAMFDISDFIAGTWLEFDSSLATVAAATKMGAHIAYKRGSCTVTDVTGGAAVPFANNDAENIECSGRGECDRTSGVCGCFEGYTGVACGSQTVLV